MCAWLRMTAERLDGGNGKLRLRSCACGPQPKTRPQSSSRRRLAASTKCIDPVTAWAAPQKVTDEPSHFPSPALFIFLFYSANGSAAKAGADLARQNRGQK